MRTMLIFSCISMFILHQFIFVQSIQIETIQKARIVNTTNSLQFNCSTCICQCLTNIRAASSSCCYVNCFSDNNTCQVIVSPMEPTSKIVMDQTSILYKTNCFDSSTTGSSTTSTSSKLITGEFSFASTMITTARARTSDVTSTRSTPSGVFLQDQPMAGDSSNASVFNP